MNTTIIGVDLGKTGGIAIIDDAVTVHAMPVIRVGKSRSQLDEQAIWDLLVECREGGHVYVIIEEVTLTPRFRPGKKGADGKKTPPEKIPQGAVTAFSQGDQRGFFRGLCRGFGIPCGFVLQRKWGPVMLHGKPQTTRDERKQSSIIRAGELFPKVSLLPTPKCTKKSNGMSDALLIAEYGRRTLNGGGAQ